MTGGGALSLARRTSILARWTSASSAWPPGRRIAALLPASIQAVGVERIRPRPTWGCRGWRCARSWCRSTGGWRGVCSTVSHARGAEPVQLAASHLAWTTQITFFPASSRFAVVLTSPLALIGRFPTLRSALHRRHRSLRDPRALALNLAIHPGRRSLGPGTDLPAGAGRRSLFCRSCSAGCARRARTPGDGVAPECRAVAPRWRARRGDRVRRRSPHRFANRSARTARSELWTRARLAASGTAVTRTPFPRDMTWQRAFCRACGERRLLFRGKARVFFALIR